jgi:hypothetical protein
MQVKKIHTHERRKNRMQNAQFKNISMKKGNSVKKIPLIRALNINPKIKISIALPKNELNKG